MVDEVEEVTVYERQEQDEKDDKPEPPKDEGNFVFLTFFLFGVASLMPWNSILNSFDFFVAEVNCAY